jgi:thiol-disulfide isomerase/thioredoxin
MLLMLLMLLVGRCVRLRSLLLVCASTAAIATAWGGVREAVVRVDGCSGVCVDPRGLVLTVRHCDLPEFVSVQFIDRTVSARRVYVCPETEGPVVFDCDGEGYPFLPIASAVPPVGAVVTSYGFPQVAGRRQLRSATGLLVRGSSFEFRCGSFRGNVVSIVCGLGWSGGPLLDRDNQVIGLLSSGDRCSSVFVSFAAVRRAYDAVAATPSGRPTLYVFHSQTCGPCLKFDEDYTQNAAFSQALNTAFEVVPVDVDERPGMAREFGITQVPAFVVAGRDLVVGYEGPDQLLASLGLSVAPVEQPESPPAEPAEPVEPPAEPEPPVEPPPAPPPNEPPPAPVEPAPSSPSVDIDERLDRVLGVAQAAVTVATWLGVSGTTGGVAGLILGGIALFRGRRHSRREQPAARDPPAVVEPPPVVTVDAPPSPPVIVPETKFAPYERDTFAQAFAWAQGELARKYPGSVGTLETLKGLIDQFLSAKGVRVNAD